ncbi:phosphotransferase family protein [Methanorbis rubei]|uniref:Aminoglycoside phosphotransferase domain-containing protein n=1 Tax=Methanorbis rubei TaxID=3028300 RepID=A0AAE4MF90_9EURY|nr:hypothetical protein [Methanocorpusculaceae archaeon Cs1]
MKSTPDPQKFLEKYFSDYHFTAIEEINRGWSSDKKYLAESIRKEKYLLRITTSAKKLPYKIQEFAALKTLEKFELPIPKPVDLKVNEDGETVLMLLGWVPGRELEEAIHELSPEDQYRLGVRAGEILAQLHTIPAPLDIPRWDEWFSKKIDKRLAEYAACGIRLPNDEKILEYIRSNRHLIQNRPQCFQHGDYHIGNMVLDEQKNLGIIDFDRMDYGDPWEEFNRITWCANASKYFASGRIAGYFEGSVPENFWKLFLLYISVNMIGSVPWAIPFGDNEVATMMKTAQDVLLWFDNMNNPIPNWYCSEIPDFFIDNFSDGQKN